MDVTQALLGEHGIVHLLVARHRRVELGGHVADERERDVGEDHAPAVRRARRIALEHANAVRGGVPLHEIGEEQSRRAAADDTDVHCAGLQRHSERILTRRRPRGSAGRL